MRHQILRTLAVALPLALPALAQDKPLPDDRKAGFESIDPELCREWLTYLSSDELRGRETGQPGYKLAAEFIAARFEEFGLKPVGEDGSYFQQVPWAAVGPDVDKSFVALRDAKGNELMRVTPGQGLGGRISENSDTELELTVLVAKSADDVVEDQVKGRALLLIDQSPPARFGTEASRALRRARPAAMFGVVDADSIPVERRIQSGGRSNRVRSARFRSPNTYVVTTAVAQKMRDLAAANPGAKLQVHMEVTEEPVFGANVVGLLEGRDPVLRNEIVGIGSHLDHIGARGDVINNGADDDGSGTTGVLAVARAFATNPIRPRRSILFMCFSGEEKGLIGSRYYVQNPLFPNDQMVAELQMDMIGRNEEVLDRRSGEVVEAAADNVNSLHLVGTEKLSMELHRLCLSINADHVGFDYEYDEEDVFSRSDHANFARADIPIAFFFTGFHPQYHRPDDTVDKINFPKLARVAKLVYAIGFELAEREDRVKRDRTWDEIPRPGR